MHRFKLIDIPDEPPPPTRYYKAGPGRPALPKKPAERQIYLCSKCGLIFYAFNNGCPKCGGRTQRFNTARFFAPAPFGDPTDITPDRSIIAAARRRADRLDFHIPPAL